MHGDIGVVATVVLSLLTSFSSLNAILCSNVLQWLMATVQCIVSQYIANMNEKEGLFSTSGSEVSFRHCELQ